ncbi:aminotransferase class V-fold PLP-dependent enzyme [Chamaesiphon minutus]|uniref:Selenocysteine lyase n=1 Tax=Chamaesiphon minutus (strain ATCC 27169 / PCC 6605) TaxID=1173020 RepID=K9UJM6_CHAP6|nr:aminotransferase class V-fold PLP-dependent enzyme [Chamaesiphon minutus]AFY95277.1 selenocysteine lyase [Chamaesiphon minutus PCC 6605]
MPVSDFTTLRKKFPLLEQRNYLATHTLGPLPQEAFLDIEAYIQSLYLGKRAFALLQERYEEMFHLIETLINAPTGSVAITASTTAAQAAIAAAIQPNAKRNRIIITDLDFPSGRYLWKSQVQRGFEIIEIKASERMQIETSDVMDRIDDRVAVVALSLVSYINSACLDIKPIIEAAHAAGAIVILDAYQAVGVLPIDVISLGADVVLGGMNKWLCGGIGLAFAYINSSLSEQLDPVYPGWFSHLQPTAFAATFVPAVGARRFQQGTPSFEPIYTSRAGLLFAIEVGVKQIHQRNIELTTYLMECADANGITINTPRSAHHRGGTVCLEVNRAEIVVQKLAALGIDVDSRSSQRIRVSPHCCNTEQECQQLIESVVELTQRDKILL